MSTNTEIKKWQEHYSHFYPDGEDAKPIEQERNKGACKEREINELRAALEEVQPAAQQGDGEWKEAQRVCDLPPVHETIQGFADDLTGDNAIMVVREVMRAIAQRAGSGEAKPVAKVTQNEFGCGLAFLANGEDSPPPGTILYTAPTAQPDNERDAALTPRQAVPSDEQINRIAGRNGIYRAMTLDDQTCKSMIKRFVNEILAAMAAQQGEKAVKP